MSDRSKHQLWLLLTALDRLRYIYPDSVVEYADAVLSVAAAIGVTDREKSPNESAPE